MKFNLKHFLAKRNLTLVEWARSHGINSVEDYDNFMLSEEFRNDLDLREELKMSLSKTDVDLSKMETKIELATEAQPEVKEAEAIEPIPELDKMAIATETGKKKRSKTEPTSI